MHTQVLRRIVFDLIHMTPFVFNYSRIAPFAIHFHVIVDTIVIVDAPYVGCIAHSQHAIPGSHGQDSPYAQL